MYGSELLLSHTGVNLGIDMQLPFCVGSIRCVVHNETRVIGLSKFEYKRHFLPIAQSELLQLRGMQNLAVPQLPGSNPKRNSTNVLYSNCKEQKVFSLATGMTGYP
jgi:hypothetical protein